MVSFDRAFWSRWEVMFVTFIIIVSLVIAGGYVSYRLISSEQETVDFGPTVKDGDVIAVDYIGMFEDGTVFDSSIQSVSENNTLYPKSLSFATKTDYTPLNFTVGTGQMISGFDTGVLGMAVNQTKVIIVPPEHGYGFSNASLIQKRSLTISVPVYEWIGNSTSFSENFFISPTIGVNVKNLQYGWNMTVFHIDSLTGDVMVKNNPFPGELLRAGEGWYAQVTSIDTSANMGMGEITVKSLLTSENVRTRIYSDQNDQQFMITNVDQINGTYTVDYNREVVGKTLYFKVTLVSLTPGA